MPELVPAKASPVIPPARFLVTQTVLWQPTRGQAQDVVPHREGSFTRILNSGEQVWIRRYAIGKRWTPLDLGWVEESGHCSHLILLNEEGTFPQVLPTPEERKAAFAKVVWLRFYDVGEKPHIYIPPLENCRFTPGTMTIFVCAPEGPAEITVVAIPGDEVRIDGQ